MSKTVPLALIGALALVAVSSRAAQTRSPGAAQTGTKLLTAIVLKVSDRSLKVLTPDHDVSFIVSPETTVIGKGRVRPMPPPNRRARLSDALEQGDLVAVTYRETGNRKVAIRIRRLEAER